MGAAYLRSSKCRLEHCFELHYGEKGSLCPSCEEWRVMEDWLSNVKGGLNDELAPV